MKQYIRLPYDSSGYGEFGVDYVGVRGRIHFQYNADHVQKIGQLLFDFCLRLNINGVLTDQFPIPYDTVLVDDKYIGDHETKRYLLMLSGSDFQFEIIARDCAFSDVAASSLIVRDD